MISSRLSPERRAGAYLHRSTVDCKYSLEWHAACGQGYGSFHGQGQSKRKGPGKAKGEGQAKGTAEAKGQGKGQAADQTCICASLLARSLGYDQGTVRVTGTVGLQSCRCR